MDGNRLRVFVVDDERVISHTLATILRLNGLAAESFHLARAALDAAISTPPDLLVSDVLMPGMTGVELAIKVKTLHPPCKVLLFSAQAHTKTLMSRKQQEEHQFVLFAKPIHPLQLLDAIRDLCPEAPNLSDDHLRGVVGP